MSTPAQLHPVPSEYLESINGPFAAKEVLLEKPPTSDREEVQGHHHRVTDLLVMMVFLALHQKFRSQSHHFDDNVCETKI